MRLNHEEIDKPKKQTTSKEIESVINNFPQKKKSTGPDGFTAEFYKYLMNN